MRKNFSYSNERMQRFWLYRMDINYIISRLGDIGEHMFGNCKRFKPVGRGRGGI